METHSSVRFLLVAKIRHCSVDILSSSRAEVRSGMQPQVKPGYVPTLCAARGVRAGRFARGKSNVLACTDKRCYQPHRADY